MKLTPKAKRTLLASLDTTLHGLERELAASFDEDQQADLINDIAYHRGLRQFVADCESDLS